MAHPTTGKRFVALSAAVALGFGGAMIAGPAAAAPSTDLKTAAAEAFSISEGIAAIGHGEDGSIVAQVDEDADEADVKKALSSTNTVAQKTTGDDVVVQKVGGTYSAISTEQPEEGEKGNFESSDDVVAGSGYVQVNEDGSAGLCSVGFPATGPDGEDAIITAGHCSGGEATGDVYVEKPSTTNVFTDSYDTFDFDGSRKLGTFTHSQYGPTKVEEVESDDDLNAETMQDFAVITVDESSGFNLVGEAATWSEASGMADDLASDTTDIAGVHDVTTEDIGSDVFHSGRTTGKTAGPIGYEGETVGIVDGYAPVADDQGNQYMVYGFASETSVEGGDSGGTVMMGDQAVGVVSGGIPAGEDEDGNQVPAMLWTAELAEGLTHLPGDYEVKTSEGTDEPTDEPTEDPSETPSEEPTEDPTTPAPTPTETDDADVDAELAVDPQEIAAERFLADDEDQAESDDRGVKYTVEGVEPGSEVLFETFTGSDAASANAGSEEAPAEETDREPAKSITVTADEDGVAQSRIWGMTTAEAEAYIGEYDVVAQTEDETLEGSFSVVAGEGDGGDEGEGGEDLPRTGSTVAPLAAGAAGLVALGGALVYVARRRQA